MLYPSFTPPTARGAKRSPFHAVLRDEHGAYFKDVSGWESPAWYVGRKGVAEDQTRAGGNVTGEDNSFVYWKNEHETIRNDVGTMDMSFALSFWYRVTDVVKF